MPDVLTPDVEIPDSESRIPNVISGQEPANAETSPKSEPATEEKVEEPEHEDAEESAPSEDEESGEDSADEHPKKSKGVQKRIDELTRQKHEERLEKEKARQEAEYWRLQAMQSQQKPETQAPADSREPRFEDFPTYEEYVDARAKYVAKKELEDFKREQQKELDAKRQQDASAVFEQKRTDARKKYADFDEVALGAHVPVSPLVANIVMSSDHFADIAYHLGKNPDVALSLTKMSPVDVAKEIGRLEMKLTQPLQAKKSTLAPPPVKTVGNSERGKKDPTKMSTEEYRKWRMQSMNKRR